MNDELNHKSDSLLPEHFNGQVFKNARESKGLTVREAAAELNILTRHIESIEQERWDALPHSAFTRGFIGNYASFLKLNSAQQVRLFDSMIEAQGSSGLKAEIDKRSPVKIDAPIPRSDTQRTAFGRTGAVLVMLALLVLFVIYLYMTNQNTPEIRSVQEPETAAQLDNPDSLIEITESAGTSMTQQITDERQELSDQVSTDPSSIDIWVIRPTQIKITDTTGQVLIDALQPRGSLSIEGISPFHVIVDQLQNIDMNINQTPQQLRQKYGAGPADIMLSAPLP